MVQWTTYFFVKGLTLWNILTDWFVSTKYNICDFTSYIARYFNKENSTWYLLSNHSLPIHHSHIQNKIHPRWAYHRSTSTLMAHTIEDPYKYTINWLSACLRIQSYDDTKWDEYPIDDFLQSLTIMTNQDTLPSLKDLFLVWCIHSHHWFSSHDTVLFQVIDNNGDFHIYDINNDKWTFSVYDTRLQITKI